MTSYLQLLGAAGPDSPPSLLLFFDNSRYLINAPEGTQRLATQNQIRLSKLHHILLTRSSTLTLGGLPGLGITLADLGVKRLTVSGGEGGAAGVMRGVRLFSVRRGMEVDVHEMRDGDESRDERVSIRAVVMGRVTRRMHTRVEEQRRAADGMQVDGVNGALQPPEKRFRVEEKSSPYHSEDDLAIASSTSSAAIIDQLLLLPAHYSHYPARPASPASFESAVTAPFLVSSPVLSFIFSLASTPGKFDPVRAKALGLKPGPLYAQLKAGQSVWVEEERKESDSEHTSEQKDDTDQPEKRGRYIHPHECVGPVRLGAEVAVIDIPWRRKSSRMHRWVHRLRHMPAFQPYHTSPVSSSPPTSTSPHLTAVVHLCGMAVLTHPLYVEWMSLFGARTQHVLVNNALAVPRSVFTSSELHHRKLQTLSHSHFCCSPLPTASSYASDAAVVSALNVPAPTVIGETLMRIHLLPIAGQAEREPVLDPPTIEAGTEKQWSDRMEQYKREAWDTLCQADLPQSSPSLSTSTFTSSLPTSAHTHLPLILPSPSDEPHTAAPPVGFTPDPHIIRRLAVLPRSHSPHLTFLGTGSAIPSKYRNVTGIFFHPGHPIPISTSLPATPTFAAPLAVRPTATLLDGWLLDCGEGTLGQCVRKWGVTGARDVLGALRVVFISHMHADHHLGLPIVIGLYVQEERKRRAAGEATRRLIVIGPRKLVAWLSVHWQHTYEEHTCDVDEDVVEATGQMGQDEVKDEDEEADVVDDDLFDFIHFFPNHTLTAAPHLLSPLLASFLVPFSLITIPVRHCPDSYAVSLHTTVSSSHSSPSSHSPLSYKLVYSGDTLPCQSLVDGGSCATLLLHESTFEDGMEAEARDKRHCTARQAVQVALKMQAERTILTHFSQRYPKLADVGGGGDDADGGVSGWMSERCAIAFDLMSVDWCDLYWLPKLTPAFADLLTDEIDEVGDEQSEQQETLAEDDATRHEPIKLSKERRRGRTKPMNANSSQLSGKRKNVNAALPA